MSDLGCLSILNPPQGKGSGAQLFCGQEPPCHRWRVGILEVGSADRLIDLEDLVRRLIDSHADGSNFSVSASPNSRLLKPLGPGWEIIEKGIPEFDVVASLALSVNAV